MHFCYCLVASAANSEWLIHESCATLINNYMYDHFYCIKSHWNKKLSKESGRRTSETLQKYIYMYMYLCSNNCAQYTACASFIGASLSEPHIDLDNGTSAE